jgi:hypothetical protein
LLEAWFGCAKFDFDQSFHAAVRRSFSRFQRRLSMTTETAIIVAAVTTAFIGFALTLWWAERQTRGIRSE